MEKLFSLWAATLVAAATMTMSACAQDEPEPQPAENLAAAPTALTFDSTGSPAQTVTVTATAAWTAKPNDAWIKITPSGASTNGTISVTLDPTTEAHTGTITIEMGTKPQTQTVTVTQTAPEAIPVASVTLDENELTLAIGEQAQLTATVLPDDATNPAVEWSSSAPTVASVDENGLVTALAPGDATITAAAKEDNAKAAECVVTVPAPVPVPVVYVAGYENQAWQNYARLWMDGEMTILSEYPSDAHAVLAAGGDVYVAGREREAEGYMQRATLWKNGVPQVLGTLNSCGRSVFVDGGDVYVAGFENDADYVGHAMLWINGQPRMLSESTSDAKAVAVVGEDIYVVGEEMRLDNTMLAAVWKYSGGTWSTLLLGENPSSATAIHASGEDVYVTWYETIAGEMDNPDYARLWRNRPGSDHLDPAPARPYGVTSAGGKVYIAGAYIIDRAANGNATLWVDGNATRLAESYSTAYSVCVAHDNVYLAGEDFGTAGLNRATLWTNGTAQTLSEIQSRATAVFVK